jgi:hypothetical protein
MKRTDVRNRRRLALTAETIAQLTQLTVFELVDVRGGLPPASKPDPGGCSGANPCSHGC